MNTLEKSRLIKELHDLTGALERRSLSLYETAKAKSRIKSIFVECDQPLFKKQILAYKAQVQPERSAEEFARDTIYACSFRGVFQQVEALEQALYTQPDSGWAILYQPASGWQIWLIPAPARTALLSDWGNLEQVYRWMLQQQHQYRSLHTDLELLNQQNYAATQAFQHTVAARSSVAIEPEEAAQQFKPTKAAPVQPEQQADSVPEAESSARHLLLNQLSCPISELPLDHLPAEKLCRVFLPARPEVMQYADVLVHDAEQAALLKRPGYVAEQINAQGRFIKYLVLFGALDAMQATRFAHAFSQQHEHEIAAIREIDSAVLESQLFALDSLFQCYQHAEQMIWHKEDYYPFIPLHLIHTQKFIQFEETAATLATPLILLKERQKIRLIHGQQRLQLARTEPAYPYILLDRQQGVSWQIIQKVLNHLPAPVDPLRLVQAIQRLTAS
ncbi:MULTISPECIES: hypothetical protein [Acinetobacter]|uniref:hypothetical protein n=1 Tax=Acinetobacter TaxID=469 RepID=UPI0013B09D62|nr:hypothetical protein [Acinetobacter indicus]MDM1771564.1 hypothetical protein [Acinetobacter indicus]MDM1774362.1 hypothetical protein [Acinetobacter indicus]QIC74528.1 hypothetical protein FSC05_12890 [Acinetobacter indicus]